MKPIHAGFCNPSGEPDSLEPTRRIPLRLSPAHLEGHLHGIGATRSGKTKWLEYFCRGLYKQQLGFTILEPQGELSRSLRSYFAYKMPRRRVIYLDPSDSETIIPFNPFRSLERKAAEDYTSYHARVSVRTEKQCESILRVWGATNTDETPRLGRWLFCVLYPVALGVTTLRDVYRVFSLTEKDYRAFIIDALEGHPVIQAEWRDLNATKNITQFTAQLESIKNRFIRFVSNPHIQRLMSISDVGIDMAEILEANAILIVNLQESDVLSRQDANLLGTLIINELWASARQRSMEAEAWRRPYFLLIDEAERFVTPDIRSILDMGSGKGLRLGLFHQHLAQFKAAADLQTYHSVMTNAKTKLVFGGLGRDDARTMAQEIFAGQIQYDEIKYILEQTKFWPVYTRDTVYTSGHSTTSVAGSGTYTGSGAGSFVGERWDPTQWPGGEYVPATQGESELTSSGSTSSSAEAESWQEGEADIPIFYPVPFREPTSVAHYTLEEHYDRLSATLMNQFQRHYFIKRPGEKTIPAVTPFVKPFKLSRSREAKLTKKILVEPYGLSAEELDSRIADQKAPHEDSSTILSDPESYRS